MKNNDWKERLGMVYSTNPDFQFDTGEEEEAETLPKNQQRLRVRMEKNGRGGKTVTIVAGFVGSRPERVGQMVEGTLGSRRKCQGWRSDCTRRLQATRHRFAESGWLYTDEIKEDK